MRALLGYCIVCVTYTENVSNIFYHKNLIAFLFAHKRPYVPTIKGFSGFSSHFASWIWGGVLYEKGKDWAGATSSTGAKEQSCASFGPGHWTPWSQQHGNHSLLVYSQLLVIPELVNSWTNCDFCFSVCLFVFKARWIFPSRNCGKWLYVELAESFLTCCLCHPQTPSDWEKLSQQCFANAILTGTYFNLLILKKLYVEKITQTTLMSNVFILLGTFALVLVSHL